MGFGSPSPGVGRPAGHDFTQVLLARLIRSAG